MILNPASIIMNFVYAIIKIGLISTPSIMITWAATVDCKEDANCKNTKNTVLGVAIALQITVLLVMTLISLM
jgi:hypothetical protein